MIEGEQAIISAMREIIRCYESVNDPESPMQSEIKMWRNRFLESMQCKNLARQTFLCIPCDSFMKHSAEENLKSCLSMESMI